MKDLSTLDKYRVPFMGDLGDNHNGMFIIPKEKHKYQVLATDGLGWEHVSMSLRTNSGDMMERIPRWEEMCEIKDMFFKPEEAVMQLHPAASEYINDHPYVLHLWRPLGLTIPVPPMTFGKNGNEYNEEKILQGQNYQYRVFITADDNWKRIGVSLLDNTGLPIERMPRWNEICEAKQMLFDPEEAVMQLHLPDNSVQSTNPNTLYLWKPVKLEIPTPPTYLIGFKKK